MLIEVWCIELFFVSSRQLKIFQSKVENEKLNFRNLFMFIKKQGDIFLIYKYMLMISPAYSKSYKVKDILVLARNMKER